MFRFLTPPPASAMIGLDISDTHLFWLAAKQVKQQFHFISAEQIQLEQALFVDGVLENTQYFSQCLQPLLNCPTRRVALSIPDHFCTTKVMHLDAELNAEDIEANVIIELENLLSYPINEVYFDFYRLPPQQTLQSITVIAAHKTIVDSRLNCLNHLGLQVACVSVDSHVLSMTDIPAQLINDSQYTMAAALAMIGLAV